MSDFVGASVEGLRELATVVRREGERIEQEIVAPLSRQVSLDRWSGPDAESFTRDWSTRLAPSLRNVAAVLAEVQRQLVEQAIQQERASGVDPWPIVVREMTAAIVGAWSRSPQASDSPPDPRWDGRPRSGEHGHAADLLELADDAYNPGGNVPDGWQLVTNDEIRKLGLNPDWFTNHSTGFGCSFYRDADGNFVVAFRGTDGVALNAESGKDWFQNLVDSTQLGDQQKQAIVLALKIQEAVDAKHPSSALSFTGHSLGGSLAALAGLATGCDTATFNAAGVSNEAVTWALDKGKDAGIWTDTLNFAADIIPYSQYARNAMLGDTTDHIKAYYTVTDPLSQAQLLLGKPAIGMGIPMLDPEHRPGENDLNLADRHNPISLRRAFDAVYPELAPDSPIDKTTNPDNGAASRVPTNPSDRTLA